MQKISVVTDKDKNINYEVHGWPMKIMRVPIILLLNALPKKLAQNVFLAFSGSDGDPRKVFNSVTTYKALETLYTFPARRTRKETKAIDFFWEYFLSNSRAIRNRLELVKHELNNAIRNVDQKDQPVRILSLGGGSARAVLEVVKGLNGKLPTEIKLIDMSRDAINYSKELALSFDLNKERIEWHRGYAHNLERYCVNFHPYIVEMVGLLDYYPREQAIDLVAKIHNKLLPGGWLITCNIKPNLESSFVTKGINWPMIYRDPDELADILLNGGFSADQIRIVYEPLKIHGIAIAQKVVQPPERC